MIHANRDGATLSVEQRQHLTDWCVFECRYERDLPERMEAYMDSLSDDDAQCALDAGFLSIYRDLRTIERRGRRYVSC